MIGYAGRRRKGGVGGWKVTLASGDHALHGAGYPLTYHFAIPTGSGMRAQFRTTAKAAWSSVAAAPAGRFDGITAARFTSGHAYVSVPFSETSDSLWLRVVNDSGVEVSTTAPDVLPLYDDRACAVVFTYDDNPHWASGLAGAAAHRAAKLWYSPGINSGTLSTDPFNPTLWRGDTLADAVAQGYCEPSNHGKNHVNANTYTSLADAQADIVGGKDGILAVTPMPPQSRGRVHAYIYPNGTYNDWAFHAVGEAGHLTARMTLAQEESVANGTYTPASWNSTWNTVPIQLPSVTPSLTTVPAEEAQARSQKVLDGIAHAKTLRGQCMVYSYISNWDWTSGQPWPSMLSTVGAMTDIWSVGQGHLALYQRTRERVTITAA